MKYRLQANGAKNENVSMTLLFALETSIVGLSNLFIEIVFSTE